MDRAVSKKRRISSLNTQEVPHYLKVWSNEAQKDLYINVSRIDYFCAGAHEGTLYVYLIGRDRPVEMVGSIAAFIESIEKAYETE